MYFSVVVPTYKDRERLLLLLEALGEQNINEVPWEVIVVNNDPQEDLILEGNYSFPLTVQNENKPGSYAARNAGFKTSKGKVIAFIDSDCIPNVDWLDVAYHCFESDFKKEIGVLTGHVPLFFKDPSNLTDAEIYEKYTGYTTEAYANEGHAITANWFSYKIVLEEFGGFNNELKSNGDSDLSGRISQKYKIVYKNNLVVHHPARYKVSELVSKYQRLLGGTYARLFKENPKGFKNYIFIFLFRRFRFFLKKFFTVYPKESLAIAKVCFEISKGVLNEYFNLIQGGETKR
ncbi:glycosyltransferase [Algoriphagus hitonicola]|uniref:Glycosyl transferase family 2 n=1 Tax=Algoriphagus hitonicola TaxID=435880 RepID=A0A1I2TL03_9BACT|nr:glycosyltransferase family 2 protein [Algoriphagus hitonicola]SFG64047.1 Glycosyl transferase family 2 [Algoriphagus hitonicola]